jgi:hypothetical protein
LVEDTLQATEATWAGCHAMHGKVIRSVPSTAAAIHSLYVRVVKAGDFVGAYFMHGLMEGEAIELLGIYGDRGEMIKLITANYSHATPLLGLLLTCHTTYRLFTRMPHHN